MPAPSRRRRKLPAPAPRRRREWTTHAARRRVPAPDSRVTRPPPWADMDSRCGEECRQRDFIGDGWVHYHVIVHTCFENSYIAWLVPAMMRITTAVAITMVAIAAGLRWTRVRAKSANVSTPLTVRKKKEIATICVSTIDEILHEQILYQWFFLTRLFFAVGRCSYKTVTGAGKCSLVGLCHIDTVQECETGFGGSTKANKEADAGNQVAPWCALLVSIPVLGFE